VLSVRETIDGHNIGHDGGGEHAQALHACENVYLLDEWSSGKKNLADEFIGFQFKAFEEIEQQPKLEGENWIRRYSPDDRPGLLPEYILLGEGE